MAEFGLHHLPGWLSPQPGPARAVAGEAQLLSALATARIATSGLLPHIAARFFNEPLCIDAMKLRVILGVLGPRLGVQGLPPLADMPPTLVRRDRSRTYAVVDGIAMVPLIGSIVKRNEGGVLADSGLLGVEALRETVASALADSNVKAILLQVDSYGGEALGTPEVARFLFESRGDKPIWASADDSAYSAGYYLAAGADRVFVSPSGGVGSIGVIALHIDESAALAAEGLKVTPIFAGDQKADGWEFAPLSDRAKARMQARVDGIWALFIRDVAQFRGIDPSMIRSYQAGTFYGADAVAARLVDGVATFDEVFTELRSQTASGTARAGGSERMADDPKKEPADTGPRADVIALDAHRSTLEAATIKARDEERQRGEAIRARAKLFHLAAEKREKLVAELIAAGTPLDEATTKLLEAQAAEEQHRGTIHGHTPESAEMVAKVPQLRTLDAVNAERFGQRGNARLTARDVEQAVNAAAGRGARA